MEQFANFLYQTLNYRFLQRLEVNVAFSSGILHKLGDLLSEHRFTIPDYQRGYSWGDKQVEAIWNDLSMVQKSDIRQHFTGVVFLSNIENAEGERRALVEVVDGQQRIVTAMLLARALARHIVEKTALQIDSRISSFSVLFRDNEELQSYFNFYALDDKGEASRLTRECSSYALNLEKSAKFFREQAEKLAAPDAQHYLEVLLDRFALFVLEAHPDFDIHVAFETLNNRGKKLSQLELLKNRLIYLTGALVDSGEGPSQEKVRQQIHLAWKGIYRSLGRSIATQNHDDEFLRGHTLGYFREEKDAEWVEKVLLDVTFSPNSPGLTLTAISQYITSLEQAAAWWAHMHEPTFLPKKHRKQLNTIARMGFAYFKPLILAVYMRATRSMPEALANPEEHAKLLEPVSKLLTEVERFIVLVLTLAGKARHSGRAYMNRLAHSILRPGISECPWRKANLPEMSDVDALEFAAAYVRAWVSNEWTDSGYSDKRFEWEGVFSATSVQEKITSRVKDSTGFYNWNFTKVLLLEYEESFRKDGNKPIRLQWDEFSFDKTVEHIYPQRPDEDGYWDAVIPIDGRSKGLKSAVLHSLGNLMLLSNTVNSSASNLPFNAKDGGRCKRSIYAGGSYSETQVAQAFKGDWDVSCIAARGIAMLKFAEKRWGVSLVDNPENPTAYLPLLFGSHSDGIRRGEAGSSRIDGRALSPKLTALGV